MSSSSLLISLTHLLLSLGPRIRYRRLADEDPMLGSLLFGGEIDLVVRVLRPKPLQILLLLSLGLLYHCHFFRYLPLIRFEAQLGVGIRKEILKLRGVIGSSRVRFPAPTRDEETLRELEDLVEALELAD
jgi:hypothetical protein